ncbi:MAG: PcfJ domain-containing protein [Bacteroidia bacterium]
MGKKILKSCNYFYKICLYQNNLLLKIAALIDLINELKEQNVDFQIIEYIESLPDSEKGLAANYVKKNISTSLDNVEQHMDRLRSKKDKIKSLKEESEASLQEDVKDIPEPYKKWFIKQILKYSNLKQKLLSEHKEIIKFVESHGLNINNFDAKEIFEEIKSSKIQNVDHPMLKSFFDQVINSENRAISLLHNDNLKRYARNKFHEFHKEWIKKIVTADKSIDEIFDEAGEIKRKMEAGELVGVDLPPSLLNHNEHAKLLQKLDFIQDYLDGESIEITTSIPVLELIKKSDEYHEEIAKARKGRQYDRIKQENITAGPEWDNEEYNGYVIVELKSANDLKVEGFKMDHCVGGENYIDKLNNNTGRIFSFRDIKNLLEPLVTLETDPGKIVIRQIFGLHDSKPDQKFIDMARIMISNIKIEDLDKLSQEDKAILAEDINTKPDVLEKLSNDRDPNIRGLVAQNKNTSKETLEKLTDDRDPNIKGLVAQNQNTSKETLEKLSDDQDRSILEAIANNPGASPETLDKLANTKIGIYHKIIVNIINNPNTSKETLDRLLNSENHKIRQCVAMNPKASPNILEKLSIDSQPLVRELAAKNPNTSLEILLKLLNDTDSDVVQAVYYNGKINTNPEILDRLANSKGDYIRGLVAGNENVNIETLDRLAIDQNKYVRSHVAENETTSPETLDKLCNDEYVGVREAVAKNPNTSLETLIKLSDNEDEAEIVLTVVSQNTKAKINPEILDRLANSKSSKIRKRVSFNPNTSTKTLEKLSNDGDKYILYNIIYHINVSLDILNKLSENEDSTVRATIATNEKTSPKILDKLSNDKNKTVLLGVATNINTRSETLEKLSDDQDPSIHEAIANNINTMAETLDKLSNDNNNDKDIGVIIAIIKNPNTSPETLNKLSFSAAYSIQYYISEKKNITSETLDRLSNAKNRKTLLNVFNHPNTSPETKERLKNRLGL